MVTAASSASLLTRRLTRLPLGGRSRKNGPAEAIHPLLDQGTGWHGENKGQHRDKGSQSFITQRPAQTLPLKTRSTQEGIARTIESSYPCSHCHGDYALDAARRLSAENLSQLLPDAEDLRGVDFSKAIFLDTETTGLARGTGTLVFLIGVASFKEDHLTLEQFFLSSPGEERAFLAAFRERLARASCVVSYNGKSFDWNLLTTRFVLNRMTMPQHIKHLDLLTLTRRLYKRRLSSVRLTQVEREILHFNRQDDVDGAQAPWRYRAYLRDGDDGLLSDIVRHNALDIVSLCGLLSMLALELDSGFSGLENTDRLCFARALFRQGKLDQAERFARAASTSDNAAVSAEAYMLLGQVALKLRAYRNAEQHFQRIIQHGATSFMLAEANLQLAKLYEHRLKVYRSALKHATCSPFAEDAFSQSKRVERLQKRLQRSQGRRLAADAKPQVAHAGEPAQACA